MRPYRKFEGVCYPNVLRGKSFSQEVRASLSDPHDFYHDEAIKLRDGDVSSFIGQNICVEHDVDFVVGTISDAWVDSQGHMRATGRVYTDSQEGRELFDAITSGDMRSLSVNYTVPMDKNNVTYGYKVPRELSVVKDPFFDGAEICVAASSKSAIEKYKSKFETRDEKKPLVFLNIMAEEVKKTEEPVPATKAVPPPPQEPSELLNRHDDLLRQMEEMKKSMAQLKEKASRAEELEQLEQKRKEEYALSQVPVLKDVLEIQKKQMQEVHGENYELPDQYVRNLTETFAAPELKENAAIIVASAHAWKKKEEDRKKIESQLTDMNEKIRKLSEEQSASGLYYEALKRHQLAVDAPPPKEVSVEASGEQKKMFKSNGAQPSAQERDLYRRATGKEWDVNVTAGAIREVQQLPKHGQEHLLPNSMKNSKEGNIIYRMLATEDYGSIKTAVNSKTLPVKEDE